MLKYITLFLMLPVITASAQKTEFDSLTAVGIKQIYNIKFEQAETTFRKLIADYPKHPAGRFFLAMIDWWKILLEPDEEKYDELFYQKLEDVIYQCDEILENDPDNVDALFFKGGAIGFRGRLRANRESWIKAADDGREALPIVEEASRLDPGNVDVKLGFGIYNYYASVIPNEYPLLKPLMIFFPDGDKEQGIKELDDVAINGKYAKYESRYFLMTLYYNYENNAYKADEYAQMLVNDFPDNPTFQRWKGRIAVRRGDLRLADSIFTDVIEKSNKNLPGYNSEKVKREADYYIGLYNRNINELDTARVYFEECLTLSKEVDGDEESGFQINTVLYLGMINDLLGNRDEAKEYYEKLLEMREYGKSHSMAKEYLEKPFSN